MEEMHRRYGPVVRISPRELVFSTVESYSEIYKYSLKDRSKILIKSAVYANRGAPHIQSERDLDKHAVIRKKLAPAFSIKALRDQEDVIHRYVDILIEQMLKLGKPGGPGIDLRDAFGWLTFDIIGT